MRNARPFVAAGVVLATVAGAIVAGYVGGHLDGTARLLVRASDDTYADLAAPARVGGAAANLMAGTGDGSVGIVFVKFRVTGLPDGRRPGGAELRLARGDRPLPPLVEVAAVPDTDWTERSLSARSAPRLGRVLASARPGPDAEDVLFDVTQAITGIGSFAFAITAPAGSGLADFLAKEANLSQYLGPQLLLSATPTLPGDPSLPAMPSLPGLPTLPDLPGMPTLPTLSPPAMPTLPDLPGMPTLSPPAMPTLPGLPGGTSPSPSASPSESPSGSPSSSDSPAPSESPSPSPTGPPSTSDCTVAARLVPTCGVLWGVAAGAHTSQPRDQALVDFEQKTGRDQAIYHGYHRGTGEMFPTKAEIAIASDPAHPRMLFLNWKPAVSTWARIAEGDPSVDGYLDQLAGYIKSNFDRPFFFTVHHEPENDVNESAGSGNTATDYRAMYRHVITRLRADGVTNLVSVMDYMAYAKWNTQPWFEDLYPGDDVVDWVAWDEYAYSDPGKYGYGDFAEMMNRTAPDWPGFYTWAAVKFPTKPLMVGEWGVWESAANPDHKPDFFSSVGLEIQLFPRVKALVYFDTPSAPTAGGRDSRVDSTPAALAAYRKLGNESVFQVDLSAAGAANY
jgi:hypothetical protein